MLSTDNKEDNGIERQESLQHEIHIIVPPPIISEDVRIRHLELYETALRGEWPNARTMFENFPNVITARDRITLQKETVLHVAVRANHTHFVKGLVEEGYMNAEDLAIQNTFGNTALHYAASSGNLELVKFMIERNKDLVLIRDKDDMLPLHNAALSVHKEIVEYLYPLSNLKDLNKEDKIELLVALINSDLYDMALILLEDYKEIAVCRDRNGETALHAVARKPTESSNLSKQDQDQQGIKFLLAYTERFFKFFSRTHVDRNEMPPRPAVVLTKNIWKQVILLDNHKIAETIRRPWPLISVAVAKGNFEFIKTLIDYYPDIIWEVDNNGHSIFHIAVSNRQKSIFDLIYSLGPVKDVIISSKDNNDNTILHLAGLLAPSNCLNVEAGEALQMQRELTWFKDVSKFVQPSNVEAVNKEGKTPRDLFVESHKDLKTKGENWMKVTANSCMVVATLIATVACSFASFTLGKEDTGFIQRISFKIFAISNAVSLIFSSISILSFLSIFVSIYEEDFYSMLPKNLVAGFASLSLSMASMTVDFCASSFIIFYEESSWIPIFMALLGSIPIIFFFRRYFLFFLKAGFTF
ncbi:Ankyrin repeat-containing protein [Melia azedarach]|uniref:Ankyrin repeat-containing protein n=1 Tax=Melia azedarach TaxID=155640 RepID=A0ACC1YCX5_MELAZ|nr:Ankyrin repeat-containing protein [Melia azedarach]